MEDNEENNNIPKEDLNNIIEIVNEIKSGQDSNEVNPEIIYDLFYYVKRVDDKNYKGGNQISDLFTNNLLFLFRTLLLQEKGVRLLIMKIIRYNIQIDPEFTIKLLDSLYGKSLLKTAKS